VRGDGARAPGARIAVVVCVFDGAGYLDQALASVAGQRRPADEVVVVDDGSSDASADVARRWALLLPLRLLVHDENRGLAAARRTAIGATDCELVALLDADDVWLPDHLLLLEHQFRRHGGIVTSSALRWVEGQALGTLGNLMVHRIPEPEAQLEQLLLRNFVFICVLFERSLYDAVGGFRSVDGVPSCEDWDLWLRMVAAGARVSGDPTPTVLYRLRADSLSGIGDDRLVESELAVLHAFVREHPGHPCLAAANKSIVEHRARRSFRLAYEAAAAGRRVAARRHAVAALRGNRSTMVRAAAMVVAPRAVAGLRRKLQARPAWLVRQ
jgi:glycosyltransferase involved in cell wall biosynthesis